MADNNELFERLKGLVRLIFWLVVFYLFIIEPVWYGILSHFRSEAVSCLHAITNAEKGHYQAHSSWSERFGEILVGIYGPARYTYFLSPTEHEGRPLEEMGLSIPVNFEALGAPDPGLTEEGFVAVAIGNIDLDKKLDVWWIDQTQMLRNPRSDMWGVWMALFKFFESN